MIIFKLPGQEKIWSINKNSEDCFVSFFSFDLRRHIDFQGRIREAGVEEFSNFKLAANAPTLEFETESEYKNRVEKTIQVIKENNLPKLVLSRRKKVEFQEINFEKTFQNLCKSYPAAFTYCFQDGQDVWLGTFSELLGKYDTSTGIFETMSLAGTLPLDENWTEKEIHEQAAVTDYISQILHKFSEEVHISDTVNHISGNIKHLKTTFQIKIEPDQVENLIQQLHPTPAVCGIPKEFCKEKIKELEKFPREFYAGYSRVEFEGILYWFVTLRCAKIYQSSAHLFVGGGITAQSNPAKEWKETELKSQAISSNLSSR